MREPIHIPGEDLLRHVAMGVGLLAEVIAVLIIVAAVLWAAWGMLAILVRKQATAAVTHVRLDLGRQLALALEFLLAADVVRTAVAPTWEDIGKLAAIAVIRTGLNYFLHRDIEEIQGSRSANGEVQTTNKDTPERTL